MSHILTTATRTHAAHLTRLISTPLLSSARLAVLPLTPPYLDESSADNDEVPLALRIPLPSKQRPTALVVGISALTGLINIEDEGATEARTARALMACAAINDQRSRLQDDLGRLIVAVSDNGLIIHNR
jgi:mediator of RNA polymerase II transcription subunit 14